MQPNNSERWTLIDELDTQQNGLLDQLELLNLRIEAVLSALNAAPEKLDLPQTKAA